MPEASDRGPPWVLFSAGGQPVEILPAGRPGTVCSVRGYTVEEAQALVQAANAVYYAKVERELEALRTSVQEMVDGFVQSFDGDRE